MARPAGTAATAKCSPTVAHALGVRLHNVMTNDVQDVGPESGPIVRVYYNGHDHYDGTMSCPRPIRSGQVRSVGAEVDPRCRTTPLATSRPMAPPPTEVGSPLPMIGPRWRRIFGVRWMRCCRGCDEEEGTRPMLAESAAGGGKLDGCRQENDRSCLSFAARRRGVFSFVA